MNGKEVRVIVFLLIIGFLADAYSVYLAENHRSNFKIFNGFILFETLFLLWYFYIILPSKPLRFFIVTSALIFSIIFFTSYFIINGNKHYLDNIAVIANIIIIILCIIYFFRQITNSEPFDFQKNHMFWIVCAYLIYSAGTLFLFLYINTLPKSEQQNDYVLNYIFLIPKSILLSIAMFMKNTIPPRKKFQLT